MSSIGMRAFPGSVSELRITSCQLSGSADISSWFIGYDQSPQIQSSLEVLFVVDVAGHAVMPQGSVVQCSVPDCGRLVHFSGSPRDVS